MCKQLCRGCLEGCLCTSGFNPSETARLCFMVRTSFSLFGSHRQKAQELIWETTTTQGSGGAGQVFVVSFGHMFGCPVKHEWNINICLDSISLNLHWLFRFKTACIRNYYRGLKPNLYSSKLLFCTYTLTAENFNICSKPKSYLHNQKILK